MVETWRGKRFIESFQKVHLSRNTRNTRHICNVLKRIAEVCTLIPKCQALTQVALSQQEPFLGESRHDSTLRAIGQYDGQYQADESVVLEGFLSRKIVLTLR